MITSKNVRNVRGVGYMTGFKYSAYIRITRKIQETNPEARLVGYQKGEAIQKKMGGEYYTAEEIIELVNAGQQ